jgi:DNA-directed RNA polymerase subunit beta'
MGRLIPAGTGLARYRNLKLVVETERGVETAAQEENIEEIS